MSAEEKLQIEFNRWAEQGRGEGMEEDHLPITEPVLEMMELQPQHRVLDMGCGAGWATRLLAARVPQGSVVGIDISDGMIRRAQQASRQFSNITYQVGSAESIPCNSNFFDRILSVESFYYYPDQQRALDELIRVLVPGGRLFILINLYKENPYSLRWVGALAVPVHALSENEYAAMFRKHGFKKVETLHVPDPSPTPETYSGKWFKNAAELREFKRIGALLIMGSKPQG
jgi:SAM-dependent methyltransferase